ncbi:hypothetical protein ACFE04_000086 [Oxalis oulophora]
MSLVDYAASDDDVSDTEEEKPKSPPASSISAVSVPVAVAPSFSNLPDASMLLNSPLLIGGGGALDIGGGDHSSLVKAALGKRESSNLVETGSRRSKIPREGHLRHTKNVPETGGGKLLPPQLRGSLLSAWSRVVCTNLTYKELMLDRLVILGSNVVTEDITKLFVKKQGGTSI